MFGHQDNRDDDNDQASQQNTIPDASIHAALEAEAIAPTLAASTGQANQTTNSEPPEAISTVSGPADDADTSATVSSSISTADDQSWQHPGQPLSAATASNSDGLVGGAGDFIITPTSTDHPSSHQAAISMPPSHEPDPSNPIDEPTAHELIDIKQQALSQLSPLMDHLDQTPEEKFRTTMMMIQASDNQSLIKTAYAAAQSIPDEKVRAQALLDIVNEINYFTQQSPAQ
jgi:hypothetical protein